MATTITSDCINCGACEPECPNNAITQGDPIYVIDPLLCTECVGFHDYEACAAVCPVDCCVTDPNRIESEEVLIARAKTLHPETTFTDNYASRFRKGAPTERSDGAVNGSGPEKMTAAPIPAPTTVSPVVAPKATEPAPPVKAATAQSAPAAKPVQVNVAKSKKTFDDELSIDFDEVAKRAGGTKKIKGPVLIAIALLQPVLGALPHQTKKRLEAAVQNSLIFSAAGSTGLNILHNAVLYPVICMIVAAVLRGPSIIFSQDINIFVFIGIIIAVVEGVYRLKDGVFYTKAPEDMEFRAAFYGAPLGILLQPILAKQAGVVRTLPIPVDGFYSKGFVDKLERERRYGNVYTVEDRRDALYVRLEFPRRMPELGLANRGDIPAEMPDYDYDIALKSGQLIIKGKCIDERVRKLSASFGAFPPEFTTVIPLEDAITGFVHKFENKALELFLLKDEERAVGSR